MFNNSNDLFRSIGRARLDLQQRRLASNRSGVGVFFPGSLSLINLKKPEERLRIPNSRWARSKVHRSIVSPGRIRSYKLDAVQLLDSKVKMFLARQVRIWKANSSRDNCILAGGHCLLKSLFRIAFRKLMEKEPEVFSSKFTDLSDEMTYLMTEDMTPSLDYNVWAKSKTSFSTEDSIFSNKNKHLASFKKLKSFHTAFVIRAKTELLRELVLTRKVYKFSWKIKAALLRKPWKLCTKDDNDVLRHLTLSEALQIIINRQTRSFFTYSNKKFRNFCKEAPSRGMKVEDVVRGIRKIDIHRKNVLRATVAKWRTVGCRMKRSLCNVLKVFEKNKNTIFCLFWGKTAAFVEKKERILVQFSSIFKVHLIQAFSKLK